MVNKELAVKIEFGELRKEEDNVEGSENMKNISKRGGNVAM